MQLSCSLKYQCSTSGLVTYMKLNMTKEAIAAYVEAKKRDKDSVDAYLNLDWHTSGRE